MSKDTRRKQRKANKAARTSRRQAKVTTKTVTPKFDTSLPTTRAEIEAAMEVLLQRMSGEGPGQVVERNEDTETLLMTSTQTELMKLQQQLFRVVFGREPSPMDPVFWDPDREHEGPFPIGHMKATRAMDQFLAKSGIRPEIAYAMALTRLKITEENNHLYSDEDLLAWEYAVGDYIHQANTGLPPLAPSEFRRAFTTVNGASAQPNVIPIGLAGHSNTTVNRMFASLQSELGTHAKAVAAMSRLSALMELAEQEEFKDIVTSTSVSDAALLAAASAEYDTKTHSFDIDSFRDRLEDLSD